MHSIQLNDQIYLKAKHAAAARGYQSVDAFVAEVVDAESSPEVEDYDRLFTPEVLAAIDLGIADAEAGRVYSADEVKAHMGQWREEWRTEQAS